MNEITNFSDMLKDYLIIYSYIINDYRKRSKIIIVS